MIQRIQSIFLLLTSAAFFLQFVFNFASSEKPVPAMLEDQVYNVQDHFLLLGLTILGGLVALVSIFMYNNRALQLRLGYLTIVFSVLLPLLAFLLIYTEKTAFNSDIAINDGVGLYLPLAGLLFSLLANRAIGKDEKLVKSMDRLR